jgi:serine protease Do
LSTTRGALVQDVTNGSPAERAGLHTYDIILEVEGRDVGTNEELIREISARQPGTTTRLGILRDARHLTVHVKLAERPLREDTDHDALDNRSLPRVPEPAPADVPLGLTIRDMSGRLEVPDSVRGVMVSRVDPTGAAFSASIRRGFVIMEINRRPVRSLADYQRVVRAAKPGDVLALYCYDPTLQQRTLITVTVE